ncbi:MAG TPA: sensor histidine kinase KdpD [Verrucomicrobiota bacterium]|nr:two-component sensor histidine kinase [Verrucomicrobiales bacterium]HRI15485.1 sensor histidine kinase KdpD [Verrucomicrobiota bacterium]
MTEDGRPNPDALLAALQRGEVGRQRGRLKVFLGMSPGVGKTYAMLEAARRERATGRDVVIGYVETHGRTETEALIEGLPSVPRRSVEHRGVLLSELDLDEVLARRPQLVLVDELAHTNAPGSRHPKRYQDVEEILAAGLDVFTTLNVQHVESRAEIVREITGAAVHETVPDSVLDGAEIELVDLPPGELLQRLGEGKVYLPERATAAAKSFFREGNLTALRELALRLAAEHVGEDTRHFRITHAIASVWKTSQRLLVALSPSPLSAPMARWTRRLADNLQAPWLAVYVDTGRALSEQDQARLQKNLDLARELGAEVITTSDQDVVAAVLRVARQHNVTQIVVGKPTGIRVLDLFRGGSVLGRLIRESGNIDVHCVHATPGETEVGADAPRWAPSSTLGQYLGALAVVAAITLLNLLLRPWTGSYTLPLLYLLSVVLLALFVGRGPVIVAAAVSALLWDFIFLEPIGTFYITSLPDAMMFGTFFVVALAMGQLTARLRAQQATERQREERATSLYLLTRELVERKDLPELLGVVVRQLSEVFAADVAVLLPDPGAREPLVAYPFGTLTVSDKEFSVAAWVYHNGRPAGLGTDTLPSAGALYLPLATSSGCIGVVGLRFRNGRLLPLVQRNLLDNFIQQIGVVLDRQRLRDAEVGAKLLAESERLGKTLLNSISHELRTPLAAITGAASGLAGTGSLAPAQEALLQDIQEAADRLNRLVRNLLDAARLESGHLKPRLDWCDPGDLCQVVAQNVASHFKDRPLVIQAPAGLPLFLGDYVLLEQALANLLVNAATYTPAGSSVELSVRVVGQELLFQVTDHGPGIAEVDLPYLFDRFYRSANAKPGGAGLGLAIVKGFVEANGGKIEVANRPQGGADFTIRLPLPAAPNLPAESL